ncbi:MAG: AraC-type DNA-binding protein [Tardiphaga sp.]|nr:AraC-type DNA-binding protein [Tardiphaga sp.]
MVRARAQRGSYQSDVVGDRFKLERPLTLLTQTASMVPIGFTRLRSERLATNRANDVPFEDAFVFHVALAPAEVDLWINNKHVLSTVTAPGSTYLFDLRSKPISETHTPFDVLRFYISQASLDELSLDSRGPRVTTLAPGQLGQHDGVLLGLAHALLASIEQPNDRNALLVDHIGLAFHAHAIRTYGSSTASNCPKAGKLSALELRRALNFMMDYLDGDPNIADIARECGLSSGYFSRAFRLTTGTTPHQWLVKKRIERARELLLMGDLELAEIAVVCGFVDQSHFSRVFSKFEGESPGRWRKRNQSL